MPWNYHFTIVYATMEILNSYSLLMLLVPTIYRPNKNFEELISSSVYPDSPITKSSNI